MATTTKQSKASKVRAYQAKHPSAGATQVAKACGTTPAYVYALRASDKNPTPKTPKQQWKVTHISTSKDAVLEKLKTMPLTSARKAEIERKVEADRIYALTKGRDRKGVTTEMMQELAKDLQAERITMVEPQADNVNHPAHYKVGGIETIDFIEAKNLNYRLGNVVKYITRADSKGNRKEDLLKAQWYLNREIAAMSK